MKIADIVDVGRGLSGTVKSDCPALMACAMLSSRHVGALAVVGEDGRIAGILSERDVITGLHEAGLAIFDRPVSDLMTREVVGCGPDTEITDAAALMVRHHIRHLPVLDAAGRPLTIISIRDILASRMAMLEADNDSLRAQLHEMAGAAGVTLLR